MLFIIKSNSINDNKNNNSGCCYYHYYLVYSSVSNHNAASFTVDNTIIIYRIFLGFGI